MNKEKKELGYDWSSSLNSIYVIWGFYGFCQNQVYFKSHFGRTREEYENDAKRYGLLLLRKPNIKEVRELFYCAHKSS